MTSVTVLPFGRPLTRADFEDVPDDGHRYELIDGSLIVSPGPQLPHQDVVGNLYLVLRAACPPELKVVLVPQGAPGPPLLAVEVLSPSTRRVDLC